MQAFPGDNVKPDSVLWAQIRNGPVTQQVKNYCLKQQETGVTQLSPADKAVQLCWGTTLGHWQSYVPIHRTAGRCPGPTEEQQDRITLFLSLLMLELNQCMQANMKGRSPTWPAMISNDVCALLSCLKARLQVPASKSRFKVLLYELHIPHSCLKHILLFSLSSSWAPLCRPCLPAVPH